MKDDFDDSGATYSFVTSNVKVVVGAGMIATAIGIAAITGGVAAPASVTLATTGTVLLATN